ncbi:MAG: VanZ family protein [Chromatiales bacterium]
MATIKLRISQRRVRQLWHVAGYLLVAAIIVLSLVPDPPTPHERGGDKVGHLLAYGTLMLWFVQLHRRPQWLRIALLCMGLGVALECAQEFVGDRTFSYADMLANAIGIAVGWMLARAGLDDLLPRIERWIGAMASP